jgi:hypothetical protein
LVFSGKTMAVAHGKISSEPRCSATVDTNELISYGTLEAPERSYKCRNHGWGL